jgi:hypothetical protein
MHEHAGRDLGRFGSVVGAGGERAQQRRRRQRERRFQEILARNQLPAAHLDIVSIFGTVMIAIRVLLWAKLWQREHDPARRLGLSYQYRPYSYDRYACGQGPEAETPLPLYD